MKRCARGDLDSPSGAPAEMGPAASLRRAENPLEESALWTALWTGFPFSGIDHTRKEGSRS